MKNFEQEYLRLGKLLEYAVLYYNISFENCCGKSQNRRWKAAYRVVECAQRYRAVRDNTEAPQNYCGP